MDRDEEKILFHTLGYDYQPRWKEDCEKFLRDLCDSCCQLLNGKKTDFCNDCVRHKWYVHK